MTKVEYNADLMRQAIQTLQQAKTELQGMRRDMTYLREVVCPGGAKETQAFHTKLTQHTVPGATARHENAIKMLDDKIDGLIAIDRQYNNGELANELGFKNIHAK